ncbi:MAG: hypothetical protein E7613_08875 [Ruminococcaceae bacterium]|nr:hypothetical protein [Oscillospiraceae bacterium]
MIYYIDSINGCDANNGQTSDNPKKDYTKLTPVSGDSILFKRGNIYSAPLESVEGVTYGAWGEGDMPTFCGSVDASNRDNWVETEENIWKYTGESIGKVGNIVLDDCYGTFRWEKDELSLQGDFWDSRQIDENKPQEYDSYELLLYSEKNPAECYKRIEICHYGKRVLGYIKSGNTFEGLRFKNSGVHGLAGQGKGVVIRNCAFENIGGVMFYKNTKVRFGNAVEFWQYGEDILIENCTFYQVYDSCVTHQGNHDIVTPAKNMICRNNTFDSYGMAAFEYRDRIPVSSSFSGNICKNAGCGFAMQGEELPRFSEIYPEPMGHHIFLWRMEKGTEGGSLVIENNCFEAAPVGAAIYSIISPDAESQITLNNNTYTASKTLLIRFGQKNYSNFEEYKRETGQDKDSRIR